MFINFEDTRIVYEMTHEPDCNQFLTEKEKNNYVAQNYHAFNGEHLGLRQVEKYQNNIKLRLGQTNFYSLLTSNLLVNRDLSNDSIDDGIKQAQAQLKKEITTESDVLNNINFSNGLAISTLILDHKGKTLLTVRSNKVAISSNFLGVSVTGAVDYSDYDAGDPFKYCIQREAQEELNINLDQENIKLIGIYIGKKKLQPIVIAYATLPLDYTWDHWQPTEGDFFVENRQHLIVDRNSMSPMINDYQMTEAALFHINHWLSLESE